MMSEYSGLNFCWMSQDVVLHKFHCIYKLYRNEGQMGQPSQRLFDCHLKSMESLVGTKN
jgi:hypothetical protein